MAEIVLVRHGETAWSATGRHTSYTDIPLTAAGQAQARTLAPLLARHRFAAVLASPRQRAHETALLAGLTAVVADEDLTEWDYGSYEGVTTPEIKRDHRPDWNLWRDGAPDGESPTQLETRVDRLLGRVRRLLIDGDVALVGHGHTLRVVGARWVGLSASAGGLLRLDVATLSVLGHEHGRPVIRHWNCGAS